MTITLASSPSPSRRTIVPVPYFGCSTTVPVRAACLGGGGTLGSTVRGATGGISCGGRAAGGAGGRIGVAGGASPNNPPWRASTEVFAETGLADGRSSQG